nr:hypothetical protein [Haliscomenobacter sp.]
MLNGAIEDTVAILDEIRNKGKHRVYALTNWSNETFPYAWITSTSCIGLKAFWFPATKS